MLNIIFILFSILFLIKAISLIIYKKTYVKVIGKLNRKRDYINKNKVDTYEYTYMYNNKKYTTKKYLDSKKKLQRGEKINLYINPREPEKNILESELYYTKIYLLLSLLLFLMIFI